MAASLRHYTCPVMAAWQCAASNSKPERREGIDYVGDYVAENGVAAACVKWLCLEEK